MPFWNGELLYIGKVGDGYSVEDAVQAALGGDLDRIRRIAKVGGFVNCVTDFGQHPAVINGASDLFVEVFGDVGKHARFAVGAGSLPMGVAVEVDAIIIVD